MVSFGFVKLTYLQFISDPNGCSLSTPASSFNKTRPDPLLPT